MPCRSLCLTMQLRPRSKKPNLYDIKTNFIRDISFEIPKNKGKRWLNAAELKKVWNADDLPYYPQQYLKSALLLGGQRVNEVYGSYVSDFDLPPY